MQKNVICKNQPQMDESCYLTLLLASYMNSDRDGEDFFRHQPIKLFEMFAYVSLPNAKKNPVLYSYFWTLSDFGWVAFEKD